MFKYRQIIFLILMTLISSCGKEIPKADVQPEDFFDITYITTHSRTPGTKAWTPVQGTFQMKFSQSGGESGTFSMHYSSYLEPQLCPYGLTCVCSGGIQGSFFFADMATDPTESPYNPMDPYNPDAGSNQGEAPSGEIDPSTGQPLISTIYTFYFGLQMEKKSLSSGCKQESNKTVKIIRFKNGELIMLNDYRELYLSPIVTE